jgi:hypothetical protein
MWRRLKERARRFARRVYDACVAGVLSGVRTLVQMAVVALGVAAVRRLGIRLALDTIGAYVALLPSPIYR